LEDISTVYSNLIKNATNQVYFIQIQGLFQNVLVHRLSTGIQLNTMRSLRPLHTLPPGRERVKEIHVKYKVKCIAVITNKSNNNINC